MCGDSPEDRSDRPRVAIIGASRDRSKYGNMAVRAHVRAGYRVEPVNNQAERIEGLKAYPSLLDVPPGRLDRVSVYLPPEHALSVLDEIARREVGEVWLNPGSDSPEVLERAAVLGLPVIRGCSIIGAGFRPDEV